MKYFLVVLLLASCASRPQFYPNEKYQEVGKEGADRDVEECNQLADQYMESGKGKQIAKSAGSGAVIGAAAGAVAGLFTGNVGRSAVFGGAVGGAGGAAAGAMSPDEVRRNFMNQCLSDKGYKVMGWK